MMNRITFTRGVPPEVSFPIETLIECAQRVLRVHGSQVLQYGNGAGYLPLREYIAEQNSVNVEQVVIGQGSLQMLDILCRVTISMGDNVFIEQPTYDRVITIFKRERANLIGFHLQDGQIDIEKLKGRLLKGIIPRYFYAIPDFQNPNGSVMNLETRNELIALALQYGFLIIEDSPYRHLRYEGKQIPRLYDLKPDIVIHMGSFSKMIGPGLRTGYMILPKEISGRLIQFATDTYISPSYFNQAIIIDFIERGLLAENIEKLKKIFHPRLKVLLSALNEHLEDSGDWVEPEGGYYVGLTLHRDIEPINLVDAETNGLVLSDGRGFFLDGGERFIRLPFCSVEEDEIKEGIQRLSELIK